MWATNEDKYFQSWKVSMFLSYEQKDSRIKKRSIWKVGWADLRQTPDAHQSFSITSLLRCTEKRDYKGRLVGKDKDSQRQWLSKAKQTWLRKLVPTLATSICFRVGSSMIHRWIFTQCCSHGVQRHSLTHHGLHHGLQGGLCFGAWGTFSNFFTHLDLCRDVLPT